MGVPQTSDDRGGARGPPPFSLLPSPFSSSCPASLVVARAPSTSRGGGGSADDVAIVASASSRDPPPIVVVAPPPYPPAPAIPFPPRSPHSSSLLVALLLILPSYDVHARAEEAAIGISFCSPSRWPGSPSRRQRRRRRRHQIRAGHHRRPRRRQSLPIRPAKGWSLCVGATTANGGGGPASNSNNGRGGTRGQGRVPWSTALRSGCAVERERIIEESAQKTYPAIYPDLFPGAE